MSKVSLRNLDQQFSGLIQKTEIEKFRDDLLKRCGYTKSVASSLKKSIKDLSSMKQAIERAQKLYSKQKDEIETKSGTLLGRPNLKSVNENDATILRHWKTISQERPIPTIENFDGDNEDLSCSDPVIIRKGRNTLKALVKDDKTRKQVEVLGRFLVVICSVQAAMLLLMLLLLLYCKHAGSCLCFMALFTGSRQPSSNHFSHL